MSRFNPICTSLYTVIAALLAAIGFLLTAL